MDKQSILGGKQPSQGLEMEQSPSPELDTTAKRLRFWRRTTRAALLCLVLTLPALALFFGWQASSSPFLFEPEPTIDQGEIPDDSSPPSKPEYDRLLGGLLTAEFDERSCLSRYQFARYHRKAARQPSTYLIKRLRKQESLQKKCGPRTNSYKNAAEQLRSGRGTNGTECKYLVSVPYRGVGNRMLAIASAFLYAVLTDRVLLMDRHKYLDDLFCEPFPDTSWLLPQHFPLKHFRDYDKESPESLGNMLKSRSIGAGSSPPFVYLHLDGSYGFFDKLFYCDDNQQLLQSVPWLLMKTDSYIVPGLFLMPAYQNELSMLFPEKDAVFHHLGRYLFHPSNLVWRSVATYYHLYLARAEERVGIQIRDFEEHGPFQHVLDQVVSCTLQEKLLPAVNVSSNVQSKAVLVTSLSSWYYEKIREMYSEHHTANGEIVRVYQPSHETSQKWGNKLHDMKALGEICLLSMTDVLITSGFSTFGYVAQGLGGLKPWIMSRPERHAVPDPPCRRAVSIEPCFHSPPYYDCKAKRDADTGKMVPHVRHCEDVSWGLKLVNDTEW